MERGDAELVRSVLDGEVRAFEELVRRYQGAVYGLAYSICGEWAAAQDLTQDTFLRAYLELARLEEPARFASWLRRIAFHAALNHLRARNARREDLDALDDVQDLLAAPEREDPIVERETALALREAIGALPSRYRIPLVLHHVRGLPQERVAHFLGVPEGTIKSLLSRARSSLRDALEPLLKERGAVSDAILSGQELPDDFAQTLVALIDACRAGDLQALERLLEEHPTLINARHGSLERSALHAAAIHGRRPIVELLLRRGANATQREGGDNAYALHFAAEQGHLEIVKLLVEAGADVQGTGDGHELDVIGWATCFRRTQRAVADYLLARGARHNVFSATALGDVSALRRVVEQDPAQLARRLTDHDARRTPLHVAVLKGQVAAAETLVALGADLEARDAHGHTPLELALLWRREAVAARLLALGARAPEAASIAQRFVKLTPVLCVKDIAASQAYYARVLGFDIDWVWGDPPSFGSCSRDGVAIFFDAVTGPPGSWLCIAVENVDLLHEQYRERGARIRKEPFTTAWSMREMQVEDLDGHVIRFTSELPFEEGG